ncbi:hypothetical protein GOV14_00565 [Candidatus Pacearchaeota archaeon]|nr:hypothetical protein [Candidatus Pacearchaeota archaeon]
MLEVIQGFIENIMAGLSTEAVIFVEIGTMLIIASILAFIVRLFKQPLIPAYILVGILLGPLVLGFISDPHLIRALSEIGVAFLIFTAGLEIKIKKLREVGKVATIGGIIQILALFGIGFGIALLLGFVGKAPVYIGLAVAFSSTMVVLKILYDKKELGSLHGRIIIGILLMQDLAAVIALTLLSSDSGLASIAISLGKAAIFVVVVIIVPKLSNKIFRKAANSTEMLLLVSISFLFLFSIAAQLSGLSLAIGAFFAGVALANSDYKTEIEGRIAPIRDFFAVIFFVALGAQLKAISSNYLVLLFVLLGIVLLLKPLIIMYLVRIFGYKKRTAFFTGNNMAQTSEFAIIMATAGFFTLKHIDQGLFSTLILLTIITMSLTTYCIDYEKKLFKLLKWVLRPLKGMKTHKENFEYLDDDEKRIIIFGCHRMGSLFLKEFEEDKKEVLVVDYNPEIIKSLISKKIPCIYGDFMNDEVLEKANIKKAEMIISTITDVEDNLYLIKKAKKRNKKVMIFVVATRISEAQLLYDAGADYVILPLVIGGQKSFELIRDIKRNKKKVKNLKKEHLKYLNSIHNILY